LTNAEIERMHREEPGSAARYLEERREEIAAEKEAEREKKRDEDWINNFVAEGGDRKTAAAALKAKKNADAAAKADRLDQEAAYQTRRHVTSRL